MYAILHQEFSFTGSMTLASVHAQARSIVGFCETKATIVTLPLPLELGSVHGCWKTVANRSIEDLNGLE